jgi:tetratricopeptide (TPR) repeat protein
MITTKKRANEHCMRPRIAHRSRYRTPRSDFLTVLCLFPASLFVRCSAMLERAYSLDPTHGTTCALLANHFFMRGQYKKVSDLASRILETTRNPQLKAEALFQKARCAHVQEQFSAARDLYHSAFQANPVHPLINVGYARLLFMKQDYALAITCLEKVYPDNKNDFHIVELLGNLYSKVGEFDKATKLLKQACDLMPRNVDLLLELAHAAQRAAPEMAFDGICQFGFSTRRARACMNSVG